MSTVLFILLSQNIVGSIFYYNTSIGRSVDDLEHDVANICIQTADDNLKNTSILGVEPNDSSHKNHFFVQKETT